MIIYSFVLHLAQGIVPLSAAAGMVFKSRESRGRACTLSARGVDAVSGRDQALDHRHDADHLGSRPR
jgi:hypothetical protein